MAKVNIIKPTGSEVLSLLSAFKTEDLTYVIFDSEKVGSMGLPIIYIAKLTGKLEKITDDNEWQSVKNYLKGIINGTSFEYVKINDTINADEVFYTPLTLPQSSFDLIKNRYVVNEDSGASEKALEPAPAAKVLDPATEVENVSVASNVSPTPALTPSISNVSPVGPVAEVTPAPVKEVTNEVVNNNSSEQIAQPTPAVAPVMPNVNAVSNASYTATPNVASEVTLGNQEVVAKPEISVAQAVKEFEEPGTKFDTNIFMQDKETFLKACENMFDALVSKYQKQLADLERREQSLKIKEQEVKTKLSDANEHLANAAAREQVANIAHDNAQRVMDITNLMPNNPNVN